MRRGVILVITLITAYIAFPSFESAQSGDEPIRAGVQESSRDRTDFMRLARAGERMRREARSEPATRFPEPGPEVLFANN